MKTERMSDQTHRLDDAMRQGDPDDTFRIGDPNTAYVDDNYSISAGKTIKLNRYNYDISRLVTSSGESEIFLITDEDGKERILKYYFSNFKPKDEVIAKLQSLKGHPIIYPVDHGVYNNRFWEINEYMPGGTLDVVFPIRNTGTLKALVSQINEVINTCHQHRIIHRDIKPSNFFFADTAQQRIVLGDFGIASPMQDKTDYKLTMVNRTSVYAAPELFTNIDNYAIIDASVDYYALGISILEAWLGGNPFKDIVEFNIMRIKMEGRVYIPEDIPTEIQTLIKGLITTEPPNRWGYEEVRKWLNGETVKVHYRTQQLHFDPYEFDRLNGLIAHEPTELARFMDLNIKKAEQQLYSGSIGQWIKESSQDLFSELYHIVENEFKSTLKENVEAGVTKAIYLLDKDRPFKGIDGTLCNSPSDIGLHIEANQSFFKQDLKRTAHATLYLFLESRGFRDRADKYRNYFKKFTADQALHLTILDLQENKLIFLGRMFENVGQLMQAPDILHPRLLQAVADRNSKVSVWLESNHPELSDNLTTWRRLNHLNMETLGYALKTGGIRIQDENILNISDFKGVFETNLHLFFGDQKAKQNRISAEYWLKNFQHHSITDLIAGLDKPFGHDPSKDLIVDMVAYVLEDANNLDNIIPSLFPSIVTACQQQPGLEDVVAPMISGAFQKRIHNDKSLNIYAVEAVEDTLRAITPLHEISPSLTEKIILHMDGLIFDLVHHDQENLKNNSDNYFDYRTECNFVVERILAPISGQMPFIEHWRNEEKVIANSEILITDKVEKEHAIGEQEINNKFDKYLKDNHKNNVNFVKKGKKLYSILLVLVCWTVGLMGLSADRLVAKESTSQTSLFSFENFIVLLLTVGSLSMAYYVRKRQPKRGLGVIFDPIHAFFGKLAYRPFIVRMSADENHDINQDTKKMKQREIDKLTVITQGKKSDLLFNENIRIAMMPNDQLQKEAGKLI